MTTRDEKAETMAKEKKGAGEANVIGEGKRPFVRLYLQK
jgi:hypothetical protein